MRTRNRYSNNKKNKYNAKHTGECENHTCKIKRIPPLSVITKVLVIVILLIGILNINNIFAYLTKFISNVNIFTINATYTVTYDSNGGSGTIPTQEISYNVPTNLYSNQNRFVKSGCVFAGWNTEPDGSGTSYSEGQQVTNIAEDNVTLYARWRKVIRYAVQVYGINEDVDSNGDSLGVTFGPAVGNSYIYRYVTHSYEETSSGSGEYYVKINTYYANQNGGESIESSTYLTDKDGNRVVRTEQEKNKYDVSIHNLTWAQIAALPDKTVLTDCMLCGDTKSVELTLNSALETSSSIVPSGDGMGMITESINGYYRKWNPAPSDNSAVGVGVTFDVNEQCMGSNARNAGGYKTSHIRASLIGSDISNPNTAYAGDVNLTSSNSIFSCIESDLRNAIVAKKVKYLTGTDYTAGNYTVNDDIADKIWLLSAREMYGVANYSGDSAEGIGTDGKGYGKFSNPQSSSYISSYTDNYCNARSINSEGSGSTCWLRSEVLSSTYNIVNLDSWGRMNTPQPYCESGIAFGFCLQSNKYTVEFDSNGGTGTAMQNQSMTCGVSKQLTANTYTRAGYEFVGWNTAANGSGTSYTDEQDVVNLSLTNNDTVTLYAQWEQISKVKYAVQIYGINQDEDADGNPLGLTFGPATGADYNNAYVTHEYEETSSGSGEYYVKIVTHTVAADSSETTTSEYLKDSSDNNVTRTAAQVVSRLTINLHDMTWAQIAAIPDKSVFEDCMLCGDTKSVELTLNSTIASGNTYNQYGDGAGILNETINGYYRIWNPNAGGNAAVIDTTGFGSNDGTGDGYSSSHIRATLVGTNAKTNEDYAGNVNLSSDTCLYSCIESDLRNVITAKKVKYITGEAFWNYDPVNTDIADKIWLFANRELYGTGHTGGITIEGLGANEEGYDKFGNPESKDYLAYYSQNATTSRVCYNENDAINYWWQRSIMLGDRSTRVYVVDNQGSVSSAPYVRDAYGLSFGFCIPAAKYQIEFNSNGGTGTMANQSMICGIQQNLTTNVFTRAGYEFDGWNTAANGSGTSYTDEEVVNNLSLTNNDTVTLYAQWAVKTKYAVQIYGINQDEDADGNPLGLTFGPATGADYNNSYVTHEYEETSSGSGQYYVKIVTHTVAADSSETTSEAYLIDSSGNNVVRTTAEKNKYDVNMHNMTWTQIAAVPDKTVFTDCMLCGDTKSVEMTLNSTLASGSRYAQYGDGAGCLHYTINDYYKIWNPNQSENSYVGTGVTLDSNETGCGSNARNAGGYSVSHIRASLIGGNTKTNEGYAGDVNLSSDTCLYSCIEEDLKQAIIPKKIKYVTGTGESNYTLNDDIADKIWLFSEREIYGGTYSGNTTEGLGSSGDGYARFSNIESKYYNVSSNPNRMCNEAGSVNHWWLRSPDLRYTWGSRYAGDYGGFGYDVAYGARGLSFGFCLPAAKYEVEFDSNGGTGTMVNQTMTCGVQKSLTANTFIRDGYKFVGWNTAANGSGTSYTDEEVVDNLSLTNNDTVTLYAQWEEVIKVKYAVQIYGIYQDEDADGNPLGLTFGPATGADYNNSYVTHEYEETSSGSGQYYVKIITHTVAADSTETTSSEYLKDSSDNNVTRTAAQVVSRLTINLHDMTWAQIAAIPDKSVFEDCMLCGDTKSVELTLNSTIASGNTYNQYGDGAGILNETINGYYRKWNPSQLDNSAVLYGGGQGSNARNAGGYSSSHIRATLVGATAKTNEDYAGDVNLNSDTCLYSCLESDLQNLIVAKNVKYVTGESNYNYDSINTDISDKIWLFANRELYGTGQNCGNSLEGLGASEEGYDKFGNPESKDYLSSYWQYATTTRVCYNENDVSHSRWLRTPYLGEATRSSIIKNDGYMASYDYTCYTNGLSFGFCIPAAKYEVEFDSNSGTGTMANQTMTCGVQQSLTANTFTREGYEFAGWNTSPGGNGTSYTDQQDVLNLSLTNNSTIKLYAQWTRMMRTKYAVQIYGINQDEDSDGNTLGLTFGPALGDNYNHKYVTHTYEETSSGSGEYYVKIVTHTVAADNSETTTSEYLKDSSNNNVVRTADQVASRLTINLHDMTWAQIAAVPDKTVFEDCMLCGDTKSITLYMNSTISNQCEYNQYGDGGGCIWSTINQYYLMWNPSYSQNTAIGTGVSFDSDEYNYGSNARNAGGYTVSNIRSTLIGKEKSNYVVGYAGDRNLTEKNCLYSCIESDLKNLIVAKKIKYVTGTATNNYTLNTDVADKIWLFSDREINGTGQYSGYDTEGVGSNGTGYAKFANTESKYYLSTYTDNTNSKRTCHNEYGSNYGFWLRSPIISNSSAVRAIKGSGDLFNNSPYYYNILIGINFGFCLPANRYTVAFDSNGGTGTMASQTMTCGIQGTLTSNTFTRAEYEFAGWNTEPDGSGTSYTDEQAVTNLSLTNNDTVTLYAQWRALPKVKYAVQIYGINQDEDADGNTLGLTFGPATGANYNNSYVTHTYEETSSGSGEYYVKIVTHTVAADSTETTSDAYLTNSSGNNVVRTTAEKNKYDINMHNMTWTQIAAVPDKTVFTDCMLCGDTKSVSLSLNSTIRSGNIYSQYGDGAGLLADTINEYYRIWNPSQDRNSAVGTGVSLGPNDLSYGTNARNNGGYKTSHIRASLIGEENSNPTTGYAGDVNLSENTCLFSCIESDLQDAIVAKKIKYVTGSSTSSYTQNVDIADKIWLFSDREMYGKGQESGQTLEGIGTSGIGYEKYSNTESNYYIASPSNGQNAKRVSYREAGMHNSWVLRSVMLSNTFGVRYVDFSGMIDSMMPRYGEGLGFGFCLPANRYTVAFDSNGGTGTMASQTMTCGIQGTLTSNTFTRAEYEFAGWNTEPDGSGTSYTDEQAVTNLSLTNNDTVTLYAQWRALPKVKYAVQIYGINQDVDSNGNTLGLTFGPAVGDNYNNKYVTHEYEEITENPGNYYVKIVTHTVASNGGETASSAYLTDSSGNNVTRTQSQVTARENINLHEMTWAQIKAVQDKTVFEDCMLCGDTKSVELSLNSTIASGTTYNQYGDGAGILSYTIRNRAPVYYKAWNLSQSQNSYVGTDVSMDSREKENGSNARNAGGYSSSHIRATLIGKNEKTNESYAGNTNLTNKTCLYSCIESDLRSVITPKKIKYVTGTSTINYTANEDIADPIWLFSEREVYGSGTNSGGTAEGLGADGDGYNVFGNTESKYHMSSYNESLNTNRAVYTEAGSTSGWWLRSPALYATYSVRFCSSRRLYNSSLFKQ